MKGQEVKGQEAKGGGKSVRGEDKSAKGPVAKKYPGPVAKKKPGPMAKNYPGKSATSQAQPQRGGRPRSSGPDHRGVAAYDQCQSSIVTFQSSSGCVLKKMRLLEKHFHENKTTQT